MESITSPMAQMAQSYPGIEGFYLLNRHAQLGFIEPGTLAARKEKFAQANDAEFTRSHPEFTRELEAFFKDTEVLLQRFAEDPTGGMELGYIVPGDPEDNRWRSATLVLHDAVIRVFKEHDEFRVEKGMKDIFKDDPDDEKLQAKRSIQRGMDDLIHHQTQFGVYLFFPVLFKLPSSQAGDRQPLRVLNLLWRADDSGSSKFSSAHIDSQQHISQNAVFDVLRDNLMTRAIDHSKRLEHRLSIDD
ncbi:MAG: hypothetical protein OEQ39_05930 [Gammaproteobacteria bacterium]|nr:hypothetical protein [Gammaproteobacteria bacterium]MDH3467498.1 hypothetical protein [Gammaproteobacteria bacterium]